MKTKEAIGDAVRLLVAFTIAFWIDKPVQEFVNTWSDPKHPSDPLHLATFITALLSTILLWTLFRLLGARPKAEVIWTDLRDKQRVDERYIQVNSAQGGASVLLEFKLKATATSLLGEWFLRAATRDEHLSLRIDFSEKVRLTRESSIVRISKRVNAITRLPAHTPGGHGDWASERIGITARDVVANFKAPVSYALEYKGKKHFLLNYVDVFSSVKTIHLKEDL